MTTTFPVATPKLPNYFISSLAQTLNAGGNDTSIQLSTIYTLDGQIVTTADFATFGRGVFTIDPINLKATEFASFTGLTAGVSPAGTATGVKRGLSFNSDTQIPANQKFHVVGAPVLISFGTHNISDIVELINDSYSELLTIIQSAIIAGAMPASPTTTGIVRTKATTGIVLGNPTISIANPAVITLNNHELTIGDTVVFTTSGTLPTAIISGQTYYVISTGLTANDFEISLTFNGTAIDTTGDTQSGTHTLTRTTPYASNFGDPYLPFYAVDAGTVNTYVITTNGTTPSLKAGMQFQVKILNTNTGASTLNVNGLGAVAITKNISQPLTGSELSANSLANFGYDGTNFQVISSTSISSPWSLVKTISYSTTVNDSTLTKIIEFTGLSGDTDDEYLIEFEHYLPNTTTGGSLGLRFNNDATSSNYTYTQNRSFFSGGTPSNASGSDNNLILTFGATSFQVASIFGDIKIKASKTISFSQRWILWNLTTTGGRVAGGGTWGDSTNQITSIQIEAYQNTGSPQTATGKMSLYKINR